ncbi:MAG: site-2 protease family protein [Parachlamydiaceae bacterium]|nr:site-2 protease family protein [Parachlamydiaceae bacterium]
MTFVSFLYIILAILGLSFLIFIHELGHYFMARLVGMRVETFSIGFGPSIYSWKRNGVEWKIGWIPFGGYVKIAGTDTSDETDMYKVNDGFFGKGPWNRIKVAFMGPFVNLLFAFIAFTFLWMAGGREKSFSEYTRKIGWIDPHSELYANGVRPGDEIVSYNNQPFQSIKDHFIAPMTSGNELVIHGNHVNSRTKAKSPFVYTVKPYPNPFALNKERLTSGILMPAEYILYDHLSNGQLNPLPEGSPLNDSGIEYGDRIVWAGGVTIYSSIQLNNVLNDSRVLMTIQRGDDIFLRRVLRVQTSELKLDPEVKEELIDWQFEADLNKIKLSQLYTIPYNLTNTGEIQSEVKFIDKDKEKEFTSKQGSDIQSPLEQGDKILAVDGIPVTYSYEIIANLQVRRINIIVERDQKLSEIPVWKEADQTFDQQFQWENLYKLTSQIGLTSPPQQAGNLYLLNTVVPKRRLDFKLAPEKEKLLTEELLKEQKEVNNIEDAEKREQVRHLLENRDKQYLLGLPQVKDERVQFNPNPVELFLSVCDEIWQTLKGLFTGSLSPKWMAGPIGIVQLVHDNSMVGMKEALFWLGAISINLGLLNLLPLPVLDGGTICFALFELITGRRLKPKTLERLVIPFALLLIGFFIFLTYHDVARLFSGWVK